MGEKAGKGEAENDRKKMSTRDNTAKTIRRLKAAGLIPQDIAVGIVYHHSSLALVKWEAQNAVTREMLNVGGTAHLGDMIKYEWTIEKKESFTFLHKGELLPPEGRGGAYIPEFRRKARHRNNDMI
jgi:hypothetical protein